jgi:hypothetical protein
MSNQFISDSSALIQKGMANHAGLIPAKAGIHVQQSWDRNRTWMLASASMRREK